MWDGFEMCRSVAAAKIVSGYSVLIMLMILYLFRKLLLSIWGAFFSTKSAFCVASVCLISAMFLQLQNSCCPFKDPQLNMLQTFCLVVLFMLYFAGLLLKVQVVENADQSAFGALLVVVLLMAFGVFLYIVVLAFLAVHGKVKQKRKLDKRLEQRPSIFNDELNASLVNYDEITLGKVIGQGASGTVREALWKNKNIAVKMLKLSTVDLNDSESGAADVIEEVKTEATVLSRLRHKNIVDYYGVSFHDGSLVVGN